MASNDPNDKFLLSNAQNSRLGCFSKEEIFLVILVTGMVVSIFITASEYSNPFTGLEPTGECFMSFGFGGAIVYAFVLYWDSQANEKQGNQFKRVNYGIDPEKDQVCFSRAVGVWSSLFAIIFIGLILVLSERTTTFQSTKPMGPVLLGIFSALAIGYLIYKWKAKPKTASPTESLGQM